MSGLPGLPAGTPGRKRMHLIMVSLLSHHARVPAVRTGYKEMEPRRACRLRMNLVWARLDKSGWSSSAAFAGQKAYALIVASALRFGLL